MNQNRKEELLTRWVDGLLSEEESRELEPFLRDDPELVEERDAYLKVRDELQASFPPKVEPPYPDFFNAHLKRVILESARKVEAGAAADQRQDGPSLARLLGWWLLPAGAALLVMAFLAGMRIGRPGEEGIAMGVVPVPAAYSPLTEVRAEAYLDEDLDSTVIVLHGLEPMSSQELVMGDRGTNRAGEAVLVAVSETY